MTEEEIHNIYLHMSGKAEGIAEATGAADFPVLFANAILEYAKRPWVGLTDEEKKNLAKAAGCTEDDDGHIVMEIFRLAEAALKKKNA